MVTFEYLKANDKEICEKKLFLCVLKIALSQHFCSILKLNYLRNMPGYPQFFSWISVALTMIYFFRIVINRAKYHVIRRHRP